MDKFLYFFSQTGFANIELSSFVMMVIALFLLYLGIAKKYEPLLLVPISFGMLLVNFPLSPLMALPENGQPGGLLHYLYLGIELGIYPPLIFLGIGALTDFSPLISNPRTLLLGAAAQIGIFGTFLGALALGFSPMEAASIGIIGGADGPTAIYLVLPDGPAPARGHFSGCLFLHGPCAHHPAAHHAPADHQKRTRHRHGRTPGDDPNGNESFSPSS
jgi:carboxybiotin decarboxylase